MSSSVEVIPIAEKYIESFYACLDSVKRERIYLGGVKAAPIESAREFVLNNIRNGYPQCIAVENEQVVGWCDIIPMKGVDFAHCGVLGMGVHKDYRGQGIGSALLESTIDKAKEYGLERVELEVYTTNTVAIELYLKKGFKVEGVKRRARKLDGKYFDLQVMAFFIDE
jgi:ribosomal protein S18 acetylase RimI-like enzyme